MRCKSSTSDIAGQQQSLGFAAQQFQEQLRQRAQDNRFRLFQAGQTGNLSSIAAGSSFANERIAGKSTDSELTNKMGLKDYAQIAASIGSVMAMSDRRLKCDVVRIGELPSGIPVYAFRYIGYDYWHVGCMADEIQPIIPEAVFEHPSGFLMVDYSMLH